jgi:Zn-dependent M28 family amino/carboxypeptidase
MLDADRAFAHVRELVSYGPHPVGSEAHQRAEDYIQSELKKLPLDVEVQSFDAITPKGTLRMRNIIARQSDSDLPVIILGSHYDTKLADLFTFVGANDSGSSTGLLLELARVWAPRKTGFRYWFVFFDGEEAIREWSAMDSLYGSREFVRQLRSRAQISQIKAFVLLDMVGDKNLDIRRDLSSTGWLVDLFWNAARQGSYSGFVEDTQAIMDDHTPFMAEGIPSIDLIDYDYGPNNSYWHTAEDTLDKISADSLRQVGEVVLKTLPALEQSLKGRESRRRP